MDSVVPFGNRTTISCRARFALHTNKLTEPGNITLTKYLGNLVRYRLNITGFCERTNLTAVAYRMVCKSILQITCKTALIIGNKSEKVFIQRNQKTKGSPIRNHRQFAGEKQCKRLTGGKIVFSAGHRKLRTRQKMSAPSFDRKHPDIF